jgi:hypothetical protein
VKKLQSVQRDLEAAETKIKDLESVRQEKEKFKKQVEHIRNYHAEMPSYKTLKTEALALSTIAEEADRWAIEFLFQDLEPNVFISAAWEEFKGDLSDDFDDLWPASNSIPAKQVRYALGLQVLGSTIEKLILQSLYIGVSANECALFLSNFGKTKGKAGHEWHIRSAIRNADPDLQTRNGQKRANTAAEKIVESLELLVPREKHDAFGEEVLRICNLALHAWQPLQGIREQTTVNFNWAPDDNEMWKVQRLPTSVAAQQSTNRGPPIMSGTGDVQKIRPLHQTATETRDTDPIEIWPVIKAGDSLVNHGIYLGRDQLHGAQKEANAEKRSNRDRKRRKQSLDGSANN